MEETKVTSEETTEEVEVKTIIGITEDEFNKILEDLKNHEEEINELREEIGENQSVIGNIDFAGITKWIALAAIGIAVAKNDGGFALDIPFFHVKFGKLF